MDGQSAWLNFVRRQAQIMRLSRDGGKSGTVFFAFGLEISHCRISIFNSRVSRVQRLTTSRNLSGKF